MTKEQIANDKKLAVKLYDLQIELIPYGKTEKQLIKQPVEMLQVDTFIARGFDFKTPTEQKRFEKDLKEYSKRNSF